MSRSSDVGDAVVASLNGGSFSVEFTSTRQYRPISQLKDLADLKVTVLVPSVTQLLVSRSGNSDQITVDILVQQQADIDDNDVVDALTNLTEALAEHVRGINFGNAFWQGTEIVAHYDMEDAANYRLFSSLIRVTYIFHWRK